MLNKYLEKKVSLEFNDEECMNCKDKIVLEYYLLESEMDSPEELVGRKAYGIEIIKTVNDKYVEKESVRNYSCYRDGSMKFLDKLAENTVTPVSLPYLLDDTIGI